jgi:hypothetical protein
MELPIVDHQLAVEQVELFHAGMGVGRIRGARREPYEHADAIAFGIGREQLAKDPGRRLVPFEFGRSSRRRD